MDNPVEHGISAEKYLENIGDKLDRDLITAFDRFFETAGLSIQRDGYAEMSLAFMNETTRQHLQKNKKLAIPDEAVVLGSEDGTEKTGLPENIGVRFLTLGTNIPLTVWRQHVYFDTKTDNPLKLFMKELEYVIK